MDTVATLDLTPIFAHYERELRGQPPFHPRMMVTLLLYCYATGTRSSRKIVRACAPPSLSRMILAEDDSRLPYRRRLPQIPPGSTGGPLRQRAQVVCLGWANSGGDHPFGWDQDQSQRLAAQGDEL